MRKYRLWLQALLLIVLIILAGCSNKQTDEKNAEPIKIETENPFVVDDEDTVMMGSIGHGFVDPELDENEKMRPLTYDGGEIEIEYSVNASGQAKNVGFLVFVDGLPQPYKLNEREAPYQYMHIFDLEIDHQDTPFKFIFTPITGEKGDNLDITITSIYHPTFIPNMKDTSSYGGYHDTLTVTNSLLFKEDTSGIEESDSFKKDYLSNVRLSTEKITSDLLEKHSGMQEVNLETLEKQVISELYFDGESAMKTDHLKISKDGKLHVSFKIFGHPGVKYKNTFYVNHEALMTKEEDYSFETVLAKGEVAVLDVEIELEYLDDFNTFYVISVPTNVEDFPDDVITLEKSRSILLYK